MMKKSLFLIGVFISIFNFVNGQSTGDSIYYEKIAGTYMFIQKGKVLSTNQVIYLMKDNMSSIKYINLAKRFQSIGTSFEVAGGLMVAYFAGKSLLRNERLNFPYFFVGAGIATLGTIANSRIPIYIKRAVNQYNEDLLYEKHKRAKLNLGITPNGFGFELKF